MTAPRPGSPEWHLDEAEQHLREADRLSATAHRNVTDHEHAVRRLLAANAAANIGALKLAVIMAAELRAASAERDELRRRAAETEGQAT